MPLLYQLSLFSMTDFHITYLIQKSAAYRWGKQHYFFEFCFCTARAITTLSKYDVTMQSFVFWLSTFNFQPQFYHDLCEPIISIPIVHYVR